jgi:hypothetical protein
MLADAALAAGLGGGTSADRYQVVVHVEPERGKSSRELSGSVETDQGLVDVSAETSRRLTCDAAVVPMACGADGDVLDVGRKTRTVPPAIRRALHARDRTCQFPGCTAEICDAHHVEHWIDGGDTSLPNVVLLCRRHHRLVHEGGFDLVRSPDGVTSVLRPDGSVLEPNPAMPPPAAYEFETDELPVWDGTPFSLADAIAVLYRLRSEDRTASVMPPR